MTDANQNPPNELRPATWARWGSFVLIFAFMMLATNAWTLNRGSAFDSPPAPWNIDGVFYDNIAVQLNQGAGFSVDFHTPAWRSAYQDANQTRPFVQKYKWVMQYQGTGATTMRSPGYPYVLAGVYRLFGHRFDAARVFGCLLVSLALSLLANWILRRWGVVACFVFCCTVVLDYSVMKSAGTIASEALAILLLACVFLSAVYAVERTSHVRWFFCGSLFALLLLTRGNWNLGLLIFLPLSMLILIPPVGKRILPIRFRHAVTFFIAVLIVATPWWIRNCSLTGRATPFGSAGTCGLAAAWCDESLDDHGHWQPQVFRDLQRAVIEDLKGSGNELVPREMEISRRSSRTAITWCKRHFNRIPELMFWRSMSHWGFFNPAVPQLLHWLNVAIVVFGFTGCLLLTGRLKGLFTVVLLVDLAIVMLTWEHLGRYAIPIRPLIHLGLALVICRFWCEAITKISPLRRVVPEWIKTDLAASSSRSGSYRTLVDK